MIAGSVDGHDGPGSTFTPMSLVHATVEPGARLDLPWDVDFNALVYVLNGSGTVGTDGRPIHTGQSAVLGAGDYLTITADQSQESRSPKLDVIVVGGQPIREPLAWAGPFVMNTKAEVLKAYEDFQQRPLRAHPRAEPASPHGRGPDLPRRVRRPARPGHRRARPRPRPGLGHGARPLLAAGVPAPPGHRHRRRGARRAPAGLGHLGAADPDRRHRPARARRAGRGDARPSSRRTSRGSTPGCTRTRPSSSGSASSPQPWEPWTPLAVFHAQHLLFASVPGKLWHHRARAVLGADEALLSRDPAYGTGSNAWAVGGARTASGRPLIGGDPHRIFESPGVYAQVRLASGDELDVFGFTFPGVPGVQHFAHAGEVAWAITNAVRATTRTSTRSPSTTWSTATRRPSRCAAPTR